MYLYWVIPVIVTLGVLLLLALLIIYLVLLRLRDVEERQQASALWHIDEDELHIDMNEEGTPVVLAHHAAGEVYGGTYRGTRVVLSPRLVANIHDTDFEREAATVVSLRHPRIVTVFGLCDLNARPYLVRELTAMGSLPDVLYGGTLKLSPADVALILRDVTEGLLFLHSTSPTPIVHAAVRPLNIFIEESWRAKVAFSGKAFSRADPQATEQVYVAPEVRAGEVATTESDVYCFGITAWETWTRSMPGDLQPSVTKVNPETGGLPLTHATLTEDMRDLLRLCLSREPAARPKMDWVLDKMKGIFQRAPQDLPEDQAKRNADETLLHSMLPLKVAQALKENRRVEAENFQMVTIFFSDIVGYTVISSKLKPVQVMAMLDKLYSAFDHLATDHGLFKVETIGDAYMAVAGLPEPQADHTLRVARFALEAVKAAQAVPIDPDDPSMGNVNIRVGVHCGPVVGSVVGKLNPRYCLFGDTVNTASRMESNSMSLMINFSDDATEQLRRQCPPLRLTPRGILDIKGKGPMPCYFLDRDDENLDTALNFEFGTGPVLPAFTVMKGSMYQSKLTNLVRQGSQRGNTQTEDPDPWAGSPRTPHTKKSEGKGGGFLHVLRHSSGGHTNHVVGGRDSGPHAGAPRDEVQAVSGSRRVPVAPTQRASLIQSLTNALGAPFKRKIAPVSKRRTLSRLDEVSEESHKPSRHPTRKTEDDDDARAKEAAVKAWDSDESDEETGGGGAQRSRVAAVVPVDSSADGRGSGHGAPVAASSAARKQATFSPEHIEEDVP